MTVCPSCGSSKVFNNGTRTLSDGRETQRLLCADCGRRFSENYIRCQGQRGNAQYAVVGTEKLDTIAELKTVMGDDLKGKILQFIVKMERQGYAETTRRLNYSCLNNLMTRGANLADPETVKEVLAKSTLSGTRKRNIINAYTSFLRFLGQTWEPPINTITRKIPFIPCEQEIDDLIAGCPNIVATMLQLLKETAMRSGEAIRLKWIDVDFQRRTIILNDPEKGSLPRIFNDLTGKLLTMLNQLPRTNDYLFGTSTMNSLKATYTRARKRIAFKLGNPRLKEIHMHTLRHWRATMEYHYTKDIMHVKEFLGHVSVENTELYVSLDKALFVNIPDENFTIRTVATLEEAVKLGEVGFEPFMTINGVQLMRKRK